MIEREGRTYRRVPEVIDAWFDSGSMPFAQWGYPHAPGSKELFAERYPADFICEAIDQTRGWFYSLMAVGTLVFDESSYRNVVCLGHILADDGRIRLHRDYWDAAEELYEKLPVLGHLMRWLRRRANT